MGQHRTIASSRFDGSFPPILRFEKLERHTVFLRFSNLALTKNLSSNLLAELCGAALVFVIIISLHREIAKRKVLFYFRYNDNFGTGECSEAFLTLFIKMGILFCKE